MLSSGRRETLQFEELLVPPSLPQFLPKGSGVPLEKPPLVCAGDNDPVGMDVIVFKGFVFSRMDVCSFVGSLPVMSFFSEVCFLVALLFAAYLIKDLEPTLEPVLRGCFLSVL